MKLYLGTKVIKAEPQEKDGKQGYKVVYQDGYESWSPKDIFEECYRELTIQTVMFINTEGQS